MWPRRAPWHTLPPIVLDMGAAYALGYQPVGDYATTVADSVQWLVEESRVDGDAQLPPGRDEAYFTGSFNYAAEDDYVAELS